MNTFNRTLRKIGRYVKATYVRFNTDSPRYWKTIQRFLTWLMGITAVASDYTQHFIIQATGYGLDIPPAVQTVAGHIATAALLARIVAGFAIDPRSVNEQEYKRLVDPAKSLRKSADL